MCRNTTYVCFVCSFITYDTVVCFFFFFFFLALPVGVHRPPSGDCGVVLDYRSLHIVADRGLAFAGLHLLLCNSTHHR
jgi:hypothetical protein